MEILNNMHLDQRRFHDSMSIDQLIQIVNLGQRQALEELLNKYENLDVNQKDDYGNFPAIIAARHNDLPILKILVEHGAKLNLKDGFNRTVMGWAQKHKNEEMKKYIDDQLSKDSLHDTQNL